MSGCVLTAGNGGGLLELLESFGGFICVTELVAKGAFSLCVCLGVDVSQKYGCAAPGQAAAHVLQVLCLPRMLDLSCIPCTAWKCTFTSGKSMLPTASEGKNIWKEMGTTGAADAIYCCLLS